MWLSPAERRGERGVWGQKEEKVGAGNCYGAILSKTSHAVLPSQPGYGSDGQGGCLPVVVET